MSIGGSDGFFLGHLGKRRQDQYRMRRSSCSEIKKEKRFASCKPLFVAAGEGFEPSHTESESAVLPLHNPAMSVANRYYYSDFSPNVKRKLQKNRKIFRPHGGTETRAGRAVRKREIKGTFSISGKRKKGFYPKIGQNRHCNRKAGMVHLGAERRRKGAL